MKHEYPVTKRVDAADVLHGTRIEDPYRWLEESGSPDVRDWVQHQNELTLSVLQEYRGLQTISEEVRALSTYDQMLYVGFSVVMAEGTPQFFYLFREAGREQPALCYQDGEQGGRVVLFDPLEVAEGGSLTIDWFMPSNDGLTMAFGLSEGGTEKSTLRVMKVQEGRLLDESIPHTKWCSLAWLHNDGFYYSRYALPGTVSQEDENNYHHVFYHRLGEDYKDDVKVFGDGRAKTEHPWLFMSDDCSLLVVASDRMTSTDIHVAKVNRRNPSEIEFRPIIENDSCESVPWPTQKHLYVLTQIGAPNGQIIRYDLSGFLANGEVPEAEIVVQESEGVIFCPDIKRFAVFDDRIAVIEENNASSSLKVYDIESGRMVDEVNLGTHVTAYQLTSAPGSNGFYYSLESFLVPVSHYRYEHGESQAFFEPRLDIDTSRYKSQLVWYTSRDGTRVSMFLLSKKRARLSSRTPVNVSGYGGFGVSVRPFYYPEFVAWVENGGVIALPHLRGGGEYGHEWHRAGNRENKQNVFDDFISAAEWLIGNGIGSRETTAISGGSNGGLLVGAALVQRPDLFSAVCCRFPLLDMIRYTRFQVAQTWIPEYGDPSIKEEFEWLYRYSPYHHVADARYPATMLQTAPGDTRTDPMHAFKMAAKLQNSSGGFDETKPTIIHTETDVGHGPDASLEKTIDLATKALVFRAHHTRMRVREKPHR